MNYETLQEKIAKIMANDSSNTTIGSMSSAEKIFTSTGDKLFAHPDVLKQIQEHKKSRPIVSHIMPTSICNLKCSFCSIKDRKLNDVLNFENQIKPYLDELIKRGLKAVIISGGGEPTLYGDFEKMVTYIANNNLDIGLITNGTTLHKYDKDFLEQFTWIRVSINSLEYDKKPFIFPKINPEKTTVGFSYVLVHEPLNINAEESLEMSDIRKKIPHTLIQIKKLTEKYPVKYVRLLPDCATPYNMLLKENQMISEIQKELGEPFFHQFKIHGEQKECYLGWVHPVLYCDGYVYPCDSLVLNDFTDQEFKEDYRLCNSNDIGTFFDLSMKSLIPEYIICKNCVFKRQNEIIKEIMNKSIDISSRYIDIEHNNFV